MATYQITTTQTAIKGLLLETDIQEALRSRKFALTMGAVLDSLSSARDVLERAREHPVDFVLINYGSGSIELLDLIRQLGREQPSIALIVILPSDTGETIKARVLRAGAWDIFTKPICIEEFQMRIRNALRIRRYVAGERGGGEHHEDEIRNAIGEILLREYETLHVLGKAAEYKDQETGTHIIRVAHYARLIARMTGEGELHEDCIFHSSALHDIGKIGIPDSILLKPARLDTGEQRIMQSHTTNGHGILEKSISTYLLNGAMIALTHHERFDGTGYPMGLPGSEIPLDGRIVCIADVFDALTTKRPYKDPWSLDRAFELLNQERGRQFDPELVDAFISNAARVEQIYYDHRD